MINLKVSIAQIGSDPAKFEDNYQRILKAINFAIIDGADLLVFPELVLCGYAHLDLVFEEDFQNNCMQYYQKLQKYCFEIKEDIGIICGVLDYQDRDVFNSAVFFQCGSKQNIQIIHKQLIPDYDIFFEQRYFTAGLGNDLIDFQGYKIGLGICEDLWEDNYQIKIYRRYVQEGADLLINISASPFQVGKLSERVDLVESLLEGSKIPLIYVNLVGSYDCYDGEIVFDGHSFIRKGPGQYHFLSSFREEQKTISINQANYAVVKTDSFESESVQAIILGIKEYFRRCHLKNAYIGLSGGIDSAVALVLTSMALGKENVTAVTMPSHVTSSETLSDAHLLAANLGVKLIERPIVKLYESWLAGYIKLHQKEPQSITRQNIQARLRGMLLMEYTNEDRQGLVISTGNKTELALGYCTMYGDMCGGLAVISDLSKEMVYKLATYLNLKQEIIPKTIIRRVPTAELEEGQKDSDNLPADYDILSPLVDELVESYESKEKLYQKYSKNIVDQVAYLIKVNEYKRRQAAPGIRITSKSFGLGRRIPIAY